MPALIADIGGTNARFVLRDRGRTKRSQTYSSDAFPTVEEAIDAFLGDDRPVAVVLAVAGPVEDGHAEGTNLPWTFDERLLAQRYGCPARLLNDFAAVAHGIDTLDASDLLALRGGLHTPDGTVAILGAGTGLGEALLVRMVGATKVISTEGGHTDFGPWDARSDRVLLRLREKYGRVSVERVASGLGLADVFDIVRSEGWAEANPATLEALGEDPGRAIGGATDDAAACLAVSLFARALGAEAGNLALKSLPAGGIRIAGGVVPKLHDHPAFRDAFLEGYLDKGRMRGVLERFAVDVVMATDVGLRGAAALAESL
jgi:glucokinase